MRQSEFESGGDIRRKILSFVVALGIAAPLWYAFESRSAELWALPLLFMLFVAAYAGLFGGRREIRAEIRSWLVAFGVLVTLTGLFWIIAR